MIKNRKPIRQTYISDAGEPDSRVLSLPLGQPGLLSLREAGVLIAGIDERNAPEVWGEWVSPTHLLFVVTAGTVGYAAPGGPPEMRAGVGEILIIPGGVSKRLTTVATPLRALWFHLRDLPRWAHLCAAQPSVRTTANAAILDALQTRLLTEALRQDPDAAAATPMLARLLLHYLERDVRPVESAARCELRTRLTRLWTEVNAAPAHAWSVAELAARLHVSAGHLHRLVREQYGVRPMEMVARLRMERAAVLLRTTEEKLEAIAAAVGYRTAYALSHAFHRHTGFRPGLFRRQ